MGPIFLVGNCFIRRATLKSNQPGKGLHIQAIQDQTLLLRLHYMSCPYDPQGDYDSRNRENKDARINLYVFEMLRE